MRELLREVLQQMSGYEAYHQSRKRARTQTAQGTYEHTVEAVVCDLIHRELELAGGSVHVTQSNQVLRKQSRYKGAALGKTLPDILKVMSAEEMDFIEMEKGERTFTIKEDDLSYHVEGKQTLLRAGPKLLSRIQRFGITFKDIGRSPDEEVIVLKGPKTRSDRPGPLVEYQDTPETETMRGQLRDINDWIAQVDITCDGSGIDTTDRRLVRIFNNDDFAQGGRLYGGFWQSMKAEHRKDAIIIDDDSIAELDYGQVGVLLLYALESKTPPEGDHYDLTAYGIPESCRAGIKKVVQAAINADSPLKRMPKGARKTIPNRISLSVILSAIQDKHHGIAQRFHAGVGLRLMRKESDILIDVLLALKKEQITALPIHDAVLVRHDKAQQAREVMVRVFKDHTGLAPKVSVE